MAVEGCRGNGDMPLRSIASKRGFFVGAAVNEEAFRSDPSYGEIIAREFNLVTCENAMKFGPLRPARDQFAFADADRIVAFAQGHGMKVRGHTLIWHRMLPDWLTQHNLSYDDCIDPVRSHIHIVTAHYRGQIMAWDVVNEAFEDDGQWRDTFFLRAFGPDYVALMFHWAQEGDPEARLFYNDFGTETVNRKSRAVHALLRELLDRSVPVHGIGFQMHLDLRAPPKPSEVAACLNWFADLGLEIHITEMDVAIPDPASQQDLDKQADIYRGILEACLSVERCTAFVTWGVTDRYSWIPSSTPGRGTALLFDENGRAKPAYYAVKEALGLGQFQR